MRSTIKRVEVSLVINMNIVTTEVTFARSRAAIRLADGPALHRHQMSALIPSAAYSGALAFIAAQPFAKGGLRGPHPWRDEPVKT